MMEAQDELRLELMHARTGLAFLLSDQVPGQASQIRSVRRHINRLVEAINGNRYRISGGAPLSAQMKTMIVVGRGMQLDPHRTASQAETQVAASGLSGPHPNQRR